MTQTQPRKNPGGRPRGYSPGPSRIITDRQAEWSWNADSLQKKQQKGSAEECWPWLGSKGPQGNLFGAFKHDRPQMTQANRLIWMTINQRPLQSQAVKMRCQNRYCCNPNHFYLAPSHRLSKNQQQLLKSQPVRYRLAITEQMISAITQPQRDQIKALAREFAHDSGIDWQWETRWMMLSEHELMLAEIKYADVLPLFQRQKIV